MSIACRYTIGEGFAFVLQNLHSSLSGVTGLTYGGGMGYTGLTGGLAIEFDFTYDSSYNDPLYAHVSV